jgi:hypothetical protein
VLHVVAFALSLAIDYAAVQYVVAANKRSYGGACGAAIFSGLLFVLGYYSYKVCFRYGEEYVIPTAMGHMIGSFLGVISGMRKDV